MKCLPKGSELMSIPLASAGTVAGDFTIPADCAAQSLSLMGEMLEVPGASEFRVSDLRLSAAGGR